MWWAKRVPRQYSAKRRGDRAGPPCDTRRQVPRSTTFAWTWPEPDAKSGLLYATSEHDADILYPPASSRPIPFSLCLTSLDRAPSSASVISEADRRAGSGQPAEVWSLDADLA